MNGDYFVYEIFVFYLGMKVINVAKQLILLKLVLKEISLVKSIRLILLRLLGKFPSPKIKGEKLNVV